MNTHICCKSHCTREIIQKMIDPEQSSLTDTPPVIYWFAHAEADIYFTSHLLFTPDSLSSTGGANY